MLFDTGLGKYFVVIFGQISIEMSFWCYFVDDKFDVKQRRTLEGTLFRRDEEVFMAENHF